MPQTLFAICAMMVAVLFALNVQRSSIDARLTMLRMESSTQASEVGVKVLEYIGSRAFDRAALTGQLLSSIDQLTAPEDFGSGIPFAACEAIEDFHEMAVFKTPVDDQMYEVTAVVRYVEESQNGPVLALAPTFMKEVEVQVIGEQMSSPVILSRVFTY